MVVAITLLLLHIGSAAFSAESILLTASDSTLVNIHRDEYGVPHIVAETEHALFFGLGFAVAQDRLYQLETTRRAAEGKMAEWFGPSYLTADAEIRQVYHTSEERLQIYDALPNELKTILSAYSEGINVYIDSMSANPAAYKPYEFAINGFTMEPWSADKTIAVSHLLARQFGGFGGFELDRLAELQTWGQTLFDQLRPVNDPTHPTTIQGGCGPTSRTRQYSGLTVSQEVIEQLSNTRKSIDSLFAAAQIPKTLGSFAALISANKSASGQVMLLGCPQSNPGAMNQNTPNVWLEVELYCPTFHFGGMMAAGLPFGLIGHHDHAAWTLTSGYSDNIDVYIDSTANASFSSYWHNGGWVPFDTLVDTIYDNVGTPNEFIHYRTVHGPVFANDLPNHQVYSYKMTFWNEEWRFLAGLNSVMRAIDLVEFETALTQYPYSFNVFYAGRDQNIKYWHVGRYQDRSDGVDPRLPHKGDGTEEWSGILPFASLPQEANPAQGFFVNWNNKPVCWWDNGDFVIPDETIFRVKDIYAYVTPVIDGFTFDNLKGIPNGISSHGNYQQAIIVPDSGEFTDQNILPPGQSGFIDVNGVKDAHFEDQWPIHLAWDFKDMLYTYSCIDPIDLDDDGTGDGCCCIGSRGNANGDPDDKVNITDITYLIQYLFGVPPGPAPTCTYEANANGDPEEKNIITDITYLIQHLFGVPAGPPPPFCP